jgi:hypothetical protein
MVSHYAAEDPEGAAIGWQPENRGGGVAVVAALIGCYRCVLVRFDAFWSAITAQSATLPLPVPTSARFAAVRPAALTNCNTVVNDHHPHTSPVVILVVLIYVILYRDLQYSH